MKVINLNTCLLYPERRVLLLNNFVPYIRGRHDYYRYDSKAKVGSFIYIRYLHLSRLSNKLYHYSSDLVEDYILRPDKFFVR